MTWQPCTHLPCAAVPRCHGHTARFGGSTKICMAMGLARARIIKPLFTVQYRVPSPLKSHHLISAVSLRSPSYPNGSKPSVWISPRFGLYARITVYPVRPIILFVLLDSCVLPAQLAVNRADYDCTRYIAYTSILNAAQERLNTVTKSTWFDCRDRPLQQDYVAVRKRTGSNANQYARPVTI
jgi:hypothetical protein